MKNKVEIETLLDEVEELIFNDEHRFFGMTYEEGIKATLDWILGNVSEHPLD